MTQPPNRRYRAGDRVAMVVLYPSKLWGQNKKESSPMRVADQEDRVTSSC